MRDLLSRSSQRSVGRAILEEHHLNFRYWDVISVSEEVIYGNISLIRDSPPMWTCGYVDMCGASSDLVSG